MLHMYAKNIEHFQIVFFAKFLFLFSCPAEENEMEIQDNSISPQCRDRACMFGFCLSAIYHIALFVCVFVCLFVLFKFCSKLQKKNTNKIFQK